MCSLLPLGGTLEKNQVLAKPVLVAGLGYKTKRFRQTQPLHALHAAMGKAVRQRCP